MNWFKKSLAGLMATLTLFGTGITTPIVADDTNEKTTETSNTIEESAAPVATATPTAAATETPVATPEATSTPEATVAPTAEATTVPTATPEATIVPTAEATATPTATPEATVAPTPTATPETVTMPAQAFAATSENGVFVSVTADENTFPAGTSMKLSAVSDEVARNAAEKVVEVDQVVAEAIAVDITFYDKTGKEIEPANENNVHVIMSTKNAIDGENHEILHITNDNSVTKVEDATVTGNDAAFDAKSFSIYVLSGKYANQPSPLSAIVGDSIKLGTTYYDSSSWFFGDNYYYYGGTWSVNDSSVIKLSNKTNTNGGTNKQPTVTATALKSGDAVVTFTTNNNHGKYTYKIHVDKKTYTLTYNANGSTSGNVPATASYDEGSNVVVSDANSLQKAGFEFVGWNTAADGNGTNYAAGTTFTIKNNITLYAQWNRTSYVISFNKNGGNLSAPESLNANASNNYTVTLPSYNGTKNGYRFLGWSKSSRLDSISYAQVLTAGSQFTLDDSKSDVTLYATWTPVANGNALFFIRTDGTIPYEPSQYSSSAYTNGIAKDGVIIDEKWVCDTTGVAVNANLTDTPSASEIQKVLPGFNPDTQYVLWYVIKAVDSTSNVDSDIYGYWHVDGVVLSKDKLNLSYDGNGNGDVSNVPLGSQYYKDNTVNVGHNGGNTGDLFTPTRTGYTFINWNTAADGSGVSYANDSTFKIQEATVLYAQWKPNSKTEYNVKWIDVTTGYEINSQTRYATTDSQVAVDAKDKQVEGYSFYDGYSKNLLTGKVAANGSLVLMLYFKPNIEITANTNSWVYDGTTHTDSGYKLKVRGQIVTVADDGTYTLSNDDVISAEIVGSVTNVVDSIPNNNKVVSTSIVNNGNDVSDNYVIRTYNGNLTITPAAITVNVTGNVASNVYDTKEHSVSGFTTDAPKGSDIVVTLKADKTASAARTNVGETPMGLTADSFTATSDNYTVTIGTVTDGKQTITPIEDLVTVTITGNHSVDYYDELEHTAEGYTVVYSNPLYTSNDYEFDGTAIATRTNVGTTNMNLNAEQFTNLNKNYTNVKFVIAEDGYEQIVPVNDNALNVTSYTGIYDGAEHSISAIALKTGSTLLYSEDNENWSETLPTYTNAAAVRTVYVKAVNPNYIDVTGKATVTINKIALTLTSGTSSKTYDGTALTNSDVTISGGKFVNNEGATYTVTGTQTAEGSSNNTFTYALNDGTNADNYTITVVEGTLTVTARPATPITPDEPQRPETPTTPERPTTPTTTETPNTGDTTNAPLAAGMMSFSMLLAALALFLKKKYSD